MTQETGYITETDFTNIEEDQPYQQMIEARLASHQE